MSQLTGDERARYVKNVFASIARHYDLMNRLMTAGQDIRWRRETVRRLQLSPGEALLDQGAGTGDLGREALRQQPDIRLVAADFSLAMLLAGERSGRLPWLNADALHLPFPDETFEAVVSGFLIRNVGNLKAALAEQYRVLKPGGRMLILETTRPRSGILNPFVRFHMRYVIPWIGGLVSGDREAYRYLPASSEAFLSAEELAGRMAAAGFREVGFHRRMAGTIAIHWGKRP
ncbi:MAG: ubiquinone/menaquinone biosynthesis methyltransferase [Anaerolineales bacterium]|jgi:demethylmenaquinone methyltransferase/2-methoxy-6-polyprenyl-1,4-benzoquinol methylase